MDRPSQESQRNWQELNNAANDVIAYAEKNNPTLAKLLKEDPSLMPPDYVVKNGFNDDSAEDIKSKFNAE